MRYLIIVTVLLSTPVFAQQFVPFTIDEKAFTDLMTAFSEMRYRDAVPVIQYLQQLEQKAQREAREKVGQLPPLKETPKAN